MKQPTGIRTRHARACPAQDGVDCKCKPTYEASVQLRGASRRKLRRSFSTLGAARAWRSEALAAQNKGLLRAPSKRTVKQAGDELLEGMRSGAIRTRSGDVYKPSAIRGYGQALRDRILPALGSAKVADVQRRDMRRIVDGMLAEGCDPSTIRNALMPARVVYRRALEDGDIALNPCDHLRLPAVRGRRDRIASPEEASKLLEALAERDRPLWACAMYAGLRSGELQALRWGNLNLGSGTNPSRAQLRP